MYKDIWVFNSSQPWLWIRSLCTAATWSKKVPWLHLVLAGSHWYFASPSHQALLGSRQTASCHGITWTRVFSERKKLGPSLKKCPHCVIRTKRRPKLLFVFIVYNDGSIICELICNSRNRCQNFIFYFLRMCMHARWGTPPLAHQLLKELATAGRAWIVAVQWLATATDPWWLANEDRAFVEELTERPTERAQAPRTNLRVSRATKRKTDCDATDIPLYENLMVSWNCLI